MQETSAPDATPICRRVLQQSIRFTVYTAILIISCLSITTAAHRGGRAYFEEGSVIEAAQLGLLLACLLQLAELYNRFRTHKSTIAALSACFAVAFIRENDASLDSALGHFGGWQLPATLAFALMGWVAWKHRAGFRQGFEDLCNCPAFSLLWTGAAVSVPIAQLLGHKPLLMIVMGADHYNPMVKRLIEESGEALGYLVCIFGLFEYRTCLKQVARQRNPHRDEAA